MKKRWWIIVVTAVVLIGAGLLAWRRLAGGEAQAAEAPETTLVRRGTLQRMVEGTGSLAAAAEVTLALPVGGRVAAVLVEEGQRVQAGQPLLRLETDELALQLAQAEASLRSAEANLDKVLAGARAEDITVAGNGLAQAYASLTEQEVALAAATERARLAWVQAANNLRDAQQAYENVYWANRELEDKIGAENVADAHYDSEERARRAVENAEAAMEQARLAYEAARQQQESSLQVGRVQVSTAQAQVDKLAAGPLATDVAVAEAAVEQTRVAVDLARLRLDKAVLTAPLAGTVTGLYVQAGEIVGSGQPAVVLSDLGNLEVRTLLDETDVAGVQVAQECEVRVDAFPGTVLGGEVTAIAQVAEVQSGVVLYPVTVRLIPGGGLLALRAGMTAEVAIIQEERLGVLIVPLRAVETAGGEAWVERWAGDHSVRVPVGLGLVTETAIEITAGLAEGDEILVVPAPVAAPASFPNPLRMLGGGGQ